MRGNKIGVQIKNSSEQKADLSDEKLSEIPPAKKPIINSEVGPPKPLSREFLLSRGYCCGLGCTNCPF